MEEGEWLAVGGNKRETEREIISAKWQRKVGRQIEKEMERERERTVEIIYTKS